MRDVGRAGERRARRRAVRAALVVVVGLVVATYLAFAKELPFASHFELRGVFSTATQLKPGSEVRRFGVKIGEVTTVDAGPDDTSVVTMQIDRSEGLHADASLAIVPRLLFEGNFYVDVRPGSPTADELDSGETIPLARTKVPVQIDQVLSALDSGTREALTSSFGELADAFGGPPRGRGFEGLRHSVRELDRALPSVRVAARGFQGTRPGDLHRAVSSGARFTAELGQDPAALAGLVTSFNRVARGLSADQEALSATVRELDRVLVAAPESLTEIDRLLPPLTSFAEELRPALRAMPSTLPQAAGLVRQINRLVRPRELPDLLDQIEPFNAHLPSLAAPLAEALSLAGHAGRCLDNTVLPAFNTVIDDGPNTTGYKIWQDTLHLGANLLGSSAGFDGNGGTLRLGLTFGANQLQGVFPGLGEFVGNGEIEGVNPIWLGAGARPEFRPDQWCEEQTIPDYTARSRIGRPPGWESSSAYQPPEAQQERQQDMLRLLVGTDADRRTLLERLLRTLPLGSPAAPPRERSRAPDTAEPTDVPKPDTPPPTPQGGPGPAPSDPPVPSNGDNPLSALLEALLGGGK